jgi:hypothetical protein
LAQDYTTGMRRVLHSHNLFSSMVIGVINVHYVPVNPPENHPPVGPNWAASA